MALKKKGMTREEAGKLYDTLRKQMEARYGKRGLRELMDDERSRRSGKGAKPAPAAAAGARRPAPAADRAADRGGLPPALPRGSGRKAALLAVLLFGGMKIALAVLEASGAAEIQSASAAMNAASTRTMFSQKQFNRDEIKVLTALDARRVELERREDKLKEHEADLERRDREFAAKLTELRDLSQELKNVRDKNDLKRKAQLDQLANVYGSMNPEEAAPLIEQLDVTIALMLLERMPEKRIGQILALMSPERALMITRMLSGGK